MSGQLRRMDEVEFWRRKAYVLSRSDRLGNLVMQSLDLIQTVQRDGIESENLSWDVQSLSRQHIKTMNDDVNRDDEVRSLMYGMSASIGSMVDSIIERRAREMYQSPRHVDSSSTGSILPHYEVVKTEDEAMDSFLENDSVDWMSEPVADEEPEANEELELPLPADVHSISGDKEDAGSAADAAAPSAARVISCSKCGKTFASERALRHHAFVHKSIRCHTCGEQMKNARALRMHTKLEHPGKKVAVAKEDVEEEASSSRATAATAAEKKQFSCSECSQVFKSMQALKTHELFHNGVKCAECGSRMKDRATLLKHFEENHLGMEARAEDNEKNDGDWKKKCPQCGVAIRCGSEYNIHMRIHTGEKPFSCAKCPSSFTASYTLKKHLRKVHGEKPYECIPCGEKFDRNTELYEHKATVHTRKRNSL